MPLLSIVVPTHERAHYAIPTITSLLELTGDETEIVVADTSTTDTISRALSSVPGWSRVTMVRPGPGLSVVDNFNAGLRAARGDYLLFLGDDDFVAPVIIELVRWACANEVDALKLSFPALYYWPDFLHKRRHDFYAGSLHIQAFSGHVVRHDALAALGDATADLGGGVGEMPRAYAGIVSRRLVERITDKYGAQTVGPQARKRQQPIAPGQAP